jgi:YVTN family beta-propeller protein
MKVKVSKLLVLLFIGVFLLSAINMVAALGVTATIPVGHAPSGLAYDSAKGEIFVTNGQDNTTSIISDSTNTVIGTIPVGGYPYGVAYDPAKGEVFVVNLFDNTVMVISDSTNAVVATIPVGRSPYNIAYDSARGELFVTNSYDGTVSVISDSTNAVVATVPVGTAPFGVAYDSSKGEIFVANQDSNSLSVISDNSNEVVATISASGCQFLAYDSGKGEIFVYTDNGVTVISDSTNAVVATNSNLNYEVQIEGLVYDSARGEVFIALHQNNEVVGISDNTNKVVETITVGHLPWVGTYDSGNHAIYYGNGGDSTVSVISSASTTSATPSPSSSGFGSIIWIIVIIIIIVLLIIIILIWLSRQRKFTVTAQNSQSQSPISGANVSGSGPQDLSGTTNNKGQTIFSDFKNGDYSIQASATGYVDSMPMSVSVKNKTEVVIKLDPALSGGPKKDSSGNSPDYEGKATTVVAKETPQIPVQSTPIIAPTPPPSLAKQETSEPQGWRDEKIQQNIKKFQEKGAISPETALTAEELGLSRIFVRIIERRKGQTKIFLEINGKYYLDQQALEKKQ